ncbi:MAG TPA: hypothetical protein PLO89_10360, partial [Spirochaetota bacterium]|nr:hypothetical protein [Spirochaetota bacterium]
GSFFGLFEKEEKERTLVLYSFSQKGGNAENADSRRENGYPSTSLGAAPFDYRFPRLSLGTSKAEARRFDAYAFSIFFIKKQF